jgi:hypothetical protein
MTDNTATNPQQHNTAEDNHRQAARPNLRRRIYLGCAALAACIVPSITATATAEAAGGYRIATGYITVQVTCNPNDHSYTISPDFGAQRVTRWQMGALNVQGTFTGWSQWFPYNFYDSRTQRISNAIVIYPHIQIEFIQNGRYYYSVLRLTNFDQQLSGSIFTQPSSTCVV